MVGGDAPGERLVRAGRTVEGDVAAAFARLLGDLQAALGAVVGGHGADDFLGELFLLGLEGGPGDAGALDLGEVLGVLVLAFIGQDGLLLLLVAQAFEELDGGGARRVLGPGAAAGL